MAQYHFREYGCLDWRNCWYGGGFEGAANGAKKGYEIGNIITKKIESEIIKFSHDVFCFVTETVPDFIVNTIWKGFIVENVYEKGLKPFGLWIWNDVWKPASENPVVNGILAIGGLTLTILGAVVSAPVWGTVILAAGIVTGVASVLLWFRTLFE